MKRNKNKKGFTIVELVIVIGVIGILSAILIPTFVNLTSKANEAALKSNLANAYSMYAAEAADGVVDSATSKTIVFKAQSEVVLSDGATTPTYYTYKSHSEGAAVEWAKENVTISGYTLAVADDTTSSTFGGYIVYVKK